MVINLPQMWLAAAAQHKVFLTHRIDHFLTIDYPSQPRPMSAALYAVASFLRQYGAVIANPNKVDFSRIAKKYDRRFPPNTPLRSEMRSIFEKIFNYDAFIKPSPLTWNAYGLCGSAKWSLCPYCHIVGTETYGTGDAGSHRGQLDHFLGRADYPFLGLSLGNLVLSCGKCNGPGFKHTKNFVLEPHLHPLIDRENVRFELVAKDAAKASDPLITTYRAESKEYKLQAVVSAPCSRTAASIETFKLDTIYEHYVPAARRIAQSVHRLWEGAGPTSRQLMIQQAAGLAVDANICDFDPSTRHGYRTVPTGKMQLDIFKNTESEILANLLSD